MLEEAEPKYSSATRHYQEFTVPDEYKAGFLKNLMVECSSNFIAAIQIKQHRQHKHLKIP